MEAFLALLLFTRKPLRMVWMLLKLLRPHLGPDRA